MIQTIPYFEFVYIHVFYIEKSNVHLTRITLTNIY